MERGLKTSYSGDTPARSWNVTLYNVLERLPIVLICVLAAFTTGRSAVTAAGTASEAALEHYEQAVSLRTALEGRPENSRKVEDFWRVIEKFRGVYYTSPASSKADDALIAVAELYQAMGRQFKASKYFHQAIKTYTFLEKEYPASPFCADALYGIAETYLNDLNDRGSARDVLEQLLKKYPHSGKKSHAQARLNDLREVSRHAHKSDSSALITQAAAAESEQKKEERSPSAAQHQDFSDWKGLALVRQIRYANNDDYIRVVIAGNGITQFTSGKLPNPARVYIDIDNARLSSKLSTSISVSGEALQQIRTGHLNEKISRIVFDLDQLHDYHVFQLSAPDRIIVDIKNPSSSRRERATNSPRMQVSSLLSDELSVPSRFTPPQPIVSKAEKPDPDSKAPKPSMPQANKDIKTAHSQSASGTTKKEPFPEKEPSSEPKHRDVASSKPLRITNQDPSQHGVSKTQNDSRTPAVSPAESAAASRVARPRSDGTRSLIRTLGLKIGRIVIDPGHGGHDTGTIGPSGLQEKDLVLDISLRLKTLIEERLGGEVILTRHDDTFVPLEDRTAIANSNQADLFLSIHANSSRNKRVGGVETFFLSFATSPDSEEVAARENASAQKTVFELQDLIKQIALKEKIEESKELANFVQKMMASHLYSTPASKDRGVKQAPFIVLIGANMPSVLAEVSFVSNPAEEKLLKNSNHRQKVAEALCKGIEGYVESLSGVKTARNAISQVPPD